ncbi:MAG: hypothetical protein Q8807_04015, partial ['Waltheria sp.' little leaf phytoplasma]|nr:hypothetical protein ['Waltheria sp.' little leaf phytoplasma]
LQSQLGPELAAAEKFLAVKDEEAFHYFLYLARQQSEEAAEALIAACERVFRFNSMEAGVRTRCDHVVALMQPFAAAQQMEEARYRQAQLKEGVLALTAEVQALRYRLSTLPDFGSYPVPDDILEVNNTHLTFITATGHYHSDNLEEIWGYMQRVRSWLLETGCLGSCLNG